MIDQISAIRKSQKDVEKQRDNLKAVIRDAIRDLGYAVTWEDVDKVKMMLDNAVNPPRITDGVQGELKEIK